MIDLFNKKLFHKSNIKNSIMIVILSLYPMRHLFSGVDLTDVGFSIDRFRQCWTNPDLSTFLSNLLGNLFLKLPLGNTLLGLKLYSALLLSITAVSIFVIFKKKTSPLLIFWGEILALSLCWCPTIVLYNYLTYVLMTFALLSLYFGLVNDKLVLILISGAIIGLNVYSRFPNVTNISFISIIWFYSWIKRKSFKSNLISSFLFISGFLVGFFILYIFIAIKFGDSAYLNMIKQLFTMGSSDKSYTMDRMVLTIIQQYLKAAQPFALLSVIGLLSTYFFSKTNINRNKMILVLSIVMICCLYLFYTLNIFDFNYKSYRSVYWLVVLFHIFTLFIVFTAIFHKKSTDDHKLISFIIMLHIFITPIGTNNHLFANMNNMFLIFPYTLSYMYFIIVKLKDKQILSIRKKDVKIFTLPLKLILSFAIILITIQSLLFGLFFIYRDGTNGRINTWVQGNKVLKGSRSEEAKALALSEISLYSQQNHLPGMEAIFYGEIPLMSFVLDIPPAISSVWPGLRTYAVDEFQKELNRVSSEIATNRPLVIISGEIYHAFASGVNIEEKTEILMEFLTKNSYSKTFSNDFFIVFE